MARPTARYLRCLWAFRSTVQAADAARWRLLVAPCMAFVLLVLVACSSSGPSEGRAAAADTPTVTHTVTATAWVLITADSDDTLEGIDGIVVSPRSIVVDAGETVALSAGAITPGGVTPGIYEDAISVTGFRNTPQGIQYVRESASVTVIGDSVVPALASVAIYPKAPTVLTGQIYRLRAVGFDEDGMVIPGVSFVWQLDNPTLGELNSIGYLTVEGQEGFYEGGVKVTGIWEGKKVLASTDVGVVATTDPDEFLYVQILPHRFFLDPGDQLQLRAVGLNGLGELVTGTQLRWDMMVPEAGVIDGNGTFVAGGRPGIYTEAVRVEAVVPGEQGFIRAADFASVVVREKKESGRLHTLRVTPETVVLPQDGKRLVLPYAVDETGETVGNVVFSQESLDESVGRFDEYGSIVATGSPGTYPRALKVTAVQQVNGETIHRASLVGVIITGDLTTASVIPEVLVVESGRTVHFSAVGKDQNGVDLVGLVVKWNVTDEHVGTIDAFGNFTAGPNPGLYEGVISAEVIQTLPKN